MNRERFASIMAGAVCRNNMRNGSLVFGVLELRSAFLPLCHLQQL